MDWLLIVLAVAAGIALIVLLLGFYMIYPGKRRREIERYRSVKYAHRGLHDDTKAENSMSAFKAAKEHGYGIELDVRLSKDGQLVVFHDDNLTRVVGKEGKVVDFTADELAKMRLCGTSDGVPTFREVLELIDGAVPLLVELKSVVGESGVTERFVEEIADYRGEYVVESFDPMALRTLKKMRPHILRGILSTTYTKDERYKGKILYRLAENLMLNFLMRPDFIAYDHKGYTVRNLRLIRRSFGTPLFAWTVKSLEEENAAVSHGFDTVIFEGYLSEK